MAIELVIGSGNGSGAIYEGNVVVGQEIMLAVVEIGQVIGQSVATDNIEGLSRLDPDAVSLYQYVPIYDDTTLVVVGFGWVHMGTWDDTNGYNNGLHLGRDKGNKGGLSAVLKLTRSTSPIIGCGNVSGVLVPGVPQDTTVFTGVFQQNSQFLNSLYAPVLVNHYIGR